VAIGAEEFKRCLATWPSGVTILTSCAGDRVHGMTVSDFSGASLSPPLVCACCNKDSNTTKLIAEGKCFAVNILAADQQALSSHFASSKTEARRFEGVEYTRGETGAPLLAGVAISLDCRLVATYDAGDHVIYLGEVEEASVYEREPLVYCGGRYRALGEPITS